MSFNKPEQLQRVRHQRRARALAKSMGLAIEVGRNAYGPELTVEAPAGQVFACRDVHELVESAWPDSTAESVWASLAESLSHGLRVCCCDDCGGSDLPAAVSVSFTDCDC